MSTMSNTSNTSRTRATRRGFLGSVAVAGAGVWLVPRCAVAASGQTPPGEKINIGVDLGSGRD